MERKEDHFKGRLHDVAPRQPDQAEPKPPPIPAQRFDRVPEKPAPYRGLTCREPSNNQAPPREQTQSAPLGNDSVIAAIKTCLLLGVLTFWLIFGLGFFVAAAGLSTYAMATHRLREGAGFLFFSLIGATFGGIGATMVWTTIFATLVATR